MKKLILCNVGLFVCLTSSLANQESVTLSVSDNIHTLFKLADILSKKELLEKLKVDLDSLLKEKRTHPLTMAVIHLLNLGKPKPHQSLPKPSSSIQPSRCIEDEYTHENEIREALKKIIEALLADQSKKLDEELQELISQIKNQ